MDYQELQDEDMAELEQEHRDGGHVDAVVYGCPACEDEHAVIGMFSVRRAGRPPMERPAHSRRR